MKSTFDEGDVDEVGLSDSLVDRITNHIALSSAILKSQHKSEPDLTYDERVDYARKLLESKPGTFLYRFGKYLQREHLQYFSSFVGDPEVDFYLGETQKLLNEHTSRISQRNQRYRCMENLKSSGSYFSEDEMRKREPLLYSQLVSRTSADEERDWGERSSGSTEQMSFSSFLLEQIDHKCEEEKRKKQEDREREVEEETDSESASEAESDESMRNEQHRTLLKEEFSSSVFSKFVDGRDDDFDYSQVEGTDAAEFDRINSLDEEERYFDEEEPHVCATDNISNSSRDSPPIFKRTERNEGNKL